MDGSTLWIGWWMVGAWFFSWPIPYPNLFIYAWSSNIDELNIYINRPRSMGFLKFVNVTAVVYLLSLRKKLKSER